MTGPEHYREAQRLLGMCTAPGGGVYTETAEPLIAALAHATLAQVAATVWAALWGVSGDTRGMRAWDDATGGPAQRGRRT